MITLLGLWQVCEYLMGQQALSKDRLEVKAARRDRKLSCFTCFCPISGWRDHNYSLVYDAGKIISWSDNNKNFHRSSFSRQPSLRLLNDATFLMSLLCRSQFENNKFLISVPLNLVGSIQTSFCWKLHALIWRRNLRFPFLPFEIERKTENIGKNHARDVTFDSELMEKFPSPTCWHQKRTKYDYYCLFLHSITSRKSEDSWKN